MNILSDLITKESEKSSGMKYADAIEYITTGSIIAFSNGKEFNGNCDLHGSLTAKLFVLTECVRTLQNEYAVDYNEILDFMKSVMEDYNECGIN